MKKLLGNKIAIIIFTFPTLTLFSIIVFYPILQSVLKSLFEWDGLSAPEFIRFENYKELFYNDPDFYLSLKNGLIFAAILVVYQIGLAAIFAFIISNEQLAGGNIFRKAYFIPVVLSVTVACQLWVGVFDGHHGLLNKFLEVIKTGWSQDWLSGSNSSIFVISFVNAWQFMGYYFVIIYAAIKSIPKQYYEAAKIEGARPMTIHVKITLPLLSETFKICLIIAITGGFKAFENIYIMTGGGPGTATYTLTLLMYRSMFRLNEYGYGSAIATVLLVQCLIATIIINRFVARERIVY